MCVGAGGNEERGCALWRRTEAGTPRRFWTEAREAADEESTGKQVGQLDGVAGPGGGDGFGCGDFDADEFVEKSDEVAACGAGEGYSSGHGGSGFVRRETLSCAGV